MLVTASNQNQPPKEETDLDVLIGIEIKTIFSLRLKKNTKLKASPGNVAN